MNNKDAVRLLNKYRAGNCSEQELALLEQWYQELDVGKPDLNLQQIKLMHDKAWKNIVRSLKK